MGNLRLRNETKIIGNNNFLSNWRSDDFVSKVPVFTDLKKDSVQSAISLFSLISLIYLLLTWPILWLNQSNWASPQLLPHHLTISLHAPCFVHDFCLLRRMASVTVK